MCLKIGIGQVKKLEANEIAPTTKGLGALGCANVHCDGLVNLAPSLRRENIHAEQ